MNSKARKMSSLLLRYLILLASTAFPHLVARLLAPRILKPKGNGAVRHPSWRKRIVSGGYVAWESNCDRTSQPQPKALLAHGFDGNHKQLSAVAELLYSFGYCVTFIDPPAHGLSSGHYCDPVRYSQAIDNASRDLGCFNLFVGHSMGGSAGLLSRRLEADMYIIISSPAVMANPIALRCKQLGLSVRATSAIMNEIKKIVGVHPTDIDVRRNMSTRERPSILFHDKFDKNVPYKDAGCLVETWKSARLVTTEGLGHNRILHSEVVLSEINGFLQDHNPVGSKLRAKHALN